MQFNFEIHLTVDCTSKEEFERLKECCKEINAKVISINLEVTKQIMTSKTVKATFDEMIEIMSNDAAFILWNGFNITRRKVESCPKYIYETGAGYSYIEIHVPCHYDKVKDFDLSKLTMSWHRSFNMFKENSVMLTCRVEKDSYINLIDKDIEQLTLFGFVQDSFKKHYEYAIIDTNIDLDKGWTH